MAAAPGLLFWLLVLGPPWPVPGQPDPNAGRRFSEHKVCADEECSMLMYRGEAVEDFTGPDCRFVNFKKGDPVYVYYKLAGGSPEIWAGSVGRMFGYFPKDLIKVAHEYTKEELQVPADETDFVCFDGGRDDFDNYNVEELLGFLELDSSATKDSEKSVDKASEEVEEPPELAKDSEPEPEPVEANSEDSGGVFTENTEELQEQFLAQKSQPHANSQTDNAPREQSSFESFEEILQDKLKVTESENNKTSNSSQVSNEQDIDAYKLLKKEMTLDLKTKFGSTADALVSDDETTRLVTSLEDDFDEELDMEYYAIEKEEEEIEDNFDELPLLTFTDGEDRKVPGKPGLEGYSTDQEKDSNKEDKVEVTLPPGIKNDDKNILTTLGDTFFSIVTGGEEKTGMMDLESSNSEEEKEDDDVLVPDSKQRKPRSTTGYTDPKDAEYGLFVEVSKTGNEKHPEMDREFHMKGKGNDVEESERGLMQAESDFEDGKQEGMSAGSSPHSSKLSSLPAGEEGKDTLKSASENKENDLKEVVIHISKGMLHEEKPGEMILEHGSESESVHKAVGSPTPEKKSKEESLDTATLPGDDQHSTSKDSTEEVVLVGGPDLCTHAVEHQHEGLKEELVLKTQNQPRFSAPDELGLSRQPGEEVPTLGRNLSWQQESEMAASVSKQVNKKTGLSEEEGGKEDFSNSGLVQHKTSQGGQEVGKTEKSGDAEVPGFHTEKPAEEDDYPLEELLEDENAVSAKQSKEKHPGVQDRRSDVNLYGAEKAILGTVNPNPENEESRQETNMILEIFKKRETAAKGLDRLGKEPGNVAVGKEESPLADAKAQRPSEVSDFPDEKKTQIPGLSQVFQNKDSDDLKKDSPEEHLSTSGPAKEAIGEEISKEDHEEVEQAIDAESQGPASDDDPFHQSPPTALAPELSDHSEDLPIISSFFKEQQSLQRFLKYFDVHELEAMLQEMSLKLKSAQRESLPYNVEKVLDKVFRASESQILSRAEQMLDMRVTENKDLGMKENIFEEAAVLDDIQDLIYFVKYKHSTVEESVPLVTAPPLEEDWAGPTEEMQPPHDGFPQQSSDLNMQLPEEPGLLDQPVARDVGASEVSQEPNAKEDSDPGLLTTEGMPADATGVEKQLEAIVEEPAHATLLENTVLLTYSSILYLTRVLIATLPDDVQPGPDFYGLPWKPVLLTALLGIVSFAIFFWRTILIVKDRVYQVNEENIAEKVKNIAKDNVELVQKLSDYEHKIKESKKCIQELQKQNMVLSDEAIKYKDKIKTLEEINETLSDNTKSLRAILESEREENAKNHDLILENRKSVEKLKDVILINTSELSEVQLALSEAKLSEEKVKFECHRFQEENARLKKKGEQLQQEIENWRKAHAELSEQIKSLEKSQENLEVVLTHKDDNINALTNCITQLNRLECESESEGQNKGDELDELANGELAGDRNEKMKNEIKQMMDVSRTQTAISVVEEDLKLLQLKLRASMSTNCNLEDQIKKLEGDRNSLQSTKAGLENECQILRQKVEILNELYQQKEMALQKKLSREEYDRQEREQRLSAADETAVLTAEQVKVYKRRIEEMEEELQRTERSFKSQIATNEKKAHDYWLKARAAERAMTEEKREAANLRHKLVEMSRKMAMLQEELVIVKPMPERPNTQNPPRRGPLSQNGSFGPSPMSGGECSPPLAAEPTGRPLSATLGRREMPRSEFGSVDRPLPRPRWSSEAPGHPSTSDPGAGPSSVMNSTSRSSSPARMDEARQTVPQEPEGPSVPTVTSLAEHPVAAIRGAAPFPGTPFMGSTGGGPVPPPIRYGPPPHFYGPFGPRPLPPFGPAVRPPVGLREYAPGVPPGNRDMPLDPREFFPGYPPFRPLGPHDPREYFIPGPRLPPPAHGPQDYLPSPAARDVLPSGSRDEPLPESQRSGQDCSQALSQSP